VTPPGFSLPDFEQPLDIDAVVAACPAEATIRGMFFLDVVELLRQRQLPLPTRRYQSFGSYPLREFLGFAAEAVPRLYPGTSVREGLRRFGHTTCPTFRETMLGRVLFGTLGHDLGRILRLTANAYEASLHPGTAEIVELRANSAIIRLVDVYNFPDSYQIGVFEGGITSCRRTGEVLLRTVSPSVHEYALTWR
jgi:uncharacterized protein (TIGR02265 family)